MDRCHNAGNATWLLEEEAFVQDTFGCIITASNRRNMFDVSDSIQWWLWDPKCVLNVAEELGLKDPGIRTINNLCASSGLSLFP